MWLWLLCCSDCLQKSDTSFSNQWETMPKLVAPCTMIFPVLNWALSYRKLLWILIDSLHSLLLLWLAREITQVLVFGKIIWKPHYYVTIETHADDNILSALSLFCIRLLKVWKWNMLSEFMVSVVSLVASNFLSPYTGCSCSKQMAQAKLLSVTIYK